MRYYFGVFIFSIFCWGLLFSFNFLCSHGQHILQKYEKQNEEKLKIIRSEQVSAENVLKTSQNNAKDYSDKIIGENDDDKDKKDGLSDDLSGIEAMDASLLKVDEINPSNKSEDILSKFLGAPLALLSISDSSLLFLSKSLLSKEVLKAFKDHYGSMNPTFFIFSNVAFLFLSLYILFRIFIKTHSDQNSQLAETVAKIQLDISRVHKEKMAVAEKSKVAKDKIEEKNIENDELKSELDELKSKLHSLTKEKDGLSKQLETSKKQLNEKMAKLQERLTKCTSVVEENDYMTKLLEDLLHKTKVSEHDLKQKEKLVKDQTLHEKNLKLQIKEMEMKTSNLISDNKKISEDIGALCERTKELETEKDSLLEMTSETLNNLEHFSNEANRLRHCYHGLKRFEEEISSDHHSDGRNESDCELTLEENKDKLKEFVDISVASVKLKQIEIERDNIKHAVEIEENSRKSTEEHLQVTRHELDQLAASRQSAEQSLQAASLKMQVLSEYFKEKERELNTRLKQSEERDVLSVDGCSMNEDKIKQLESLVLQYKEQVEDLQKEMQDIEANFRKEVAAHEKKAHESWLSYRQSEKDLKETKQDVDNLKIKVSQLQDKLEKAYEVERNNQQNPIQVLFPHPMMPFPRLPFMRHPFLPPPPPPSFRPVPSPGQNGGSLRSTPLDNQERPPI